MLKNELAIRPHPHTFDDVGDDDLALLVLHYRIEALGGNRTAHAWACALEIEQRRRYQAVSIKNWVLTVPLMARTWW